MRATKAYLICVYLAVLLPVGARAETPCEPGQEVEFRMGDLWYEGTVVEARSAEGVCVVRNTTYSGFENLYHVEGERLRRAGTGDGTDTYPLRTPDLCVEGESVELQITGAWYPGTVAASNEHDGSCAVETSGYTGFEQTFWVMDERLREVGSAPEPSVVPPPVEAPDRSGETVQAAAPVAAAPVAAAPAAAKPSTVASERPPSALPSGRYICYQGGLTSRGAAYWGYVDLKGGASYIPFTGSGGSYRYDGGGQVRFQGGIFERYDWVGVARTRTTGQVEITLVERADLDYFRGIGQERGGSGIAIRCGHDGTR